MNREERIKSALSCGDVDRVPVSVWMHFSEHDQDPRALAEEQIAFNEKYDYDFIKVMPFGTYSTQDWGNKIKFYCTKYQEPIVADPAIKTLDDYDKIVELAGIHGAYGKQVQLIRHISKIITPNTPFVQTIFSPLTTLKKMTTARLLDDIKENPKVVHQVLDIIAATTINFIKLNIEAGVSGFFFATQCATYDFLTDELFAEFAEPYDLKVINSYADKTYFNIIHIHGDNIMFDVINKNYPCNCLNWHDRHTKPSMLEARKITNKCFLGGIKEVPYFVDGVLKYDSLLERSTPDDVVIHVKEALDQLNSRGLILGPGCVADPKTSEENLLAVRRALVK